MYGVPTANAISPGLLMTPGSSAFILAGGCSDAVPSPVPEVVEQMRRVDKELEALNGQLAYLEDRIAPVVRPLPPTTGGINAGAAPVPCTELARRLMEQQQHLSAFNDRLQSLLARIEL